MVHYILFMMENFRILAENKDFLMSVYGFNGVSGMMIGLLVISAVDVVFRGFAMWRAARMGKKHWFVMLLVINSMAILPIVFLLMTNAEYQKEPRRAL